jgi:D-sedoheptulose 7-phosphate isomerase
MAGATNLLRGYGGELQRALTTTQASDRIGGPVELDAAIDDVLRHLAQIGQGRVMFIGNGGSAGTASHLAIDFQKNGGFPTLAFNDGAALTCLGNDLGFEQVFASPLAAHTRPGDILFAISSSGRSIDILNGVAAARECGGFVVTLSGFTPGNPLRRQGDLNFYVESMLYGFVEISHLAVCHAVLDMHMKVITASGQPAAASSRT